jgi:CDP-paratose 2-epimerase
MKWLVTGGCGFIGTNLVSYLVEIGDEVVIVDDMSRSGVELNASLLFSKYGLEVHVVDVSKRTRLEGVFKSLGPFDAVAHLAGQVSYLASLEDPMRDFEINALGTLNILESVRRYSLGAAVIGMSSNKIYGDLDWINYDEQELRYVAPLYQMGFAEDLPIDLRGPYSCSKGVVDQYLFEYANSFGMRTASLRQSSVYGPYQHPRSDQGWVAHIVGESARGNVIKLNGVGKQVRDLLHASDLARLIRLIALKLPAESCWQVNVGGGVSNSMSILELFGFLNSLGPRNVSYEPGTSRPNDQKVFISNNNKVTSLTGWTPIVGISVGLIELIEEYLVSSSRSSEI